MASRKYSVCLNDTSRQHLPIITRIEKHAGGHSAAIQEMLLEASGKPNPQVGHRQPSLADLADGIGELLAIARSGVDTSAPGSRLDALDDLAERCLTDIDQAMSLLSEQFAL